MGPKTIRGSIRKDLTWDGRKNPRTAMRETVFGKNKKRKKRR